MTKTIEETASEAIIDNNFFIADPNHPEFVDRGLEQMRACKWVINHIFSLPLAQRLTAEEKERVRKEYWQAAKDWIGIGDARGYCRTCIALEEVFGADFFKEEG